ncbi:hypothetical protein [Hyalangium sp.]|uniref:hypothetical protein n=1 Tax=Hyalangium sp. TaxID=2028555 RepID=UPI002D3F9DD7|nr:hypothetical protein [Hyalangium sp.]HYI00396.1 hypothetical protein [Hyalangium sp.]
MNAREVAQQFGSAFMSAGRLAGQLMRGLVGAAPQLPARKGTSAEKTEARSEARESSSTVGSGEEGEPDAGPATSKPLLSGTFGAAFAALKRASLRKARKRLRKQASAGTGAGAARSVARGHPDDELDGLHGSSVRALLHGDEQGATEYDQARNVALFLEHLERQGKPPVDLLRHLNLQLGQERGDGFRKLFSEQVRPQMEALAGKVEECTSADRRRIAGLVSRTVSQVGPNSAGVFEELLLSAGASEATALAGTEESSAGRAAGLEQALRAGGSPAYRHGLIENSQEWLRALGQEWLALGPEREPLTGTLLRASELLAPLSIRLLAHAFVSGLLQSKGPDRAGTLAGSVAQGLSHAPGGASWAVQLVVALKTQGDEVAARALAEALTGALRTARQRCVPGFSRLKHLQDISDPKPQGAAGWEDFERAAVPLAAVLQGCVHVLALRSTLQPLCPELTDEAQVCLGSLDVVGATAAGQRVLRLALISQEQGMPSFLSIIPREAPALAQPAILHQLSESGLFSGHYLFGGVGFLQRVACRTARALAGPVIARTQKGDAPAARNLLRVGIRRNASLFGLSSEGAKRAVELLEPLRAKPNPTQVQRTMADLATLLREFPNEEDSGTAESLRTLVTSLGQRRPNVVSRKDGRWVTVELTPLDVVAGQSALSRRTGKK